MNLTAEQIMVLGIVAMLVVQAYKLLLAKYQNLKLDRKTLKALTAFLAFAIALVYGIQEIQAVGLDDPMAFVGEILKHVAAIFAVATLMYNYLFKELADDLGISEEKYLKIN